MDPISIYAIERGRAPADLPRRHSFLEVAFFDATIPPPVPLSVGCTIRIHTLSRFVNHNGGFGDGYTARWSGIEGRIVGVRSMELAVTEFIVKNDKIRSATEYAYLSIQHVEGLTVCLGLWRTALRTLLLPILPHTRHVPLDNDEDVILHSFAPSSTSGGRPRNALYEAEESEDLEGEVSGWNE